MKHCSAFWNHTNLRSGNRIFPCCRFKNPIQTFDGDVSTILHSDQYEKLRNTDVSTLSECSKCMHEEDNGKESLRQQFNKIYDTNNIKLQYFEIGFDNICDLACDGCWSEWSHTWALKDNPDATPKQVIVSTEELCNIPDSVNKILFLGGEPLMTSRHRKFLQTVKNLENLEVIYNTNGMHSLQQEDYNLLNKCKKVKFIVSIDGYAKLNEAVRSNSVWSKVVNNVNEFMKKFDVVIHTTIHKNNWHGLPELHKWIVDNKFNWSTNVLTYPPRLDVKDLDYNSKVAFTLMLDEFDIPNATYIKEHISVN